jgi:hypothetical protein
MRAADYISLADLDEAARQAASVEALPTLTVFEQVRLSCPWLASLSENALADLERAIETACANPKQ